MPPGSGSAAGRKFLAPRYYGQRAVFASLRALFPFFIVFVYFVSAIRAVSAALLYLPVLHFFCQAYLIMAK